MVSAERKADVELALSLIEKHGDTEKYVDALFEYGKYIIDVENDKDYGLYAIAKAKESCERIIEAGTGATVFALDDYCKVNKQRFKILDYFWKCTLVEAQNRILDSYLLYLEKNRDAKSQFYIPRRKQLTRLGLIQALQELIDGKLDRLSISMPPGTGKTTLELFMLTGVMGWFPEDYNIFWSHSGDITKMVYKAVENILTSDEYTWADIFPDCKITYTDAKLEKININGFKNFSNFQATSVGSSNAGKIRTNRLLMCDDLISGIEEALNKNRLDKLWDVYAVDSRQRKVEGAVELHVCTRWSVYDIVGRLKQIYDGKDRQKFIAVPDINPETGESNFDYDINGFSKEFFADQELVMDEVSYRCLYKNEPIEREGLLYHDEELRRYYTLPDREPDAILCVCDTKSKGIDHMVMPIVYQYDYDFYLVDCICDDSNDFEHQYSKITDMLIKHNVQECEIESNAGGDRLAYEVSERLKRNKARCNVTTKATETNKETRILVNSSWVKRNILFKDKADFVRKSDYGEFMNQMLTYSTSGKNAHDDVVDALANFTLFVTNKERYIPTTILRGIL